VVPSTIDMCILHMYVQTYVFLQTVCLRLPLCVPMCLFTGGHREVDFGQRLYVRTNAKGMHTLAHAEREGGGAEGGGGGVWREAGRDGKRARERKGRDC
jgi:hypothetical protein